MKLEPFTKVYESRESFNAYMDHLNWSSGFMHQPDSEAEESVQAESLAVEREAQEDFNEENRE